VFLGLRLKNVENILNFLAAHQLVQVHEKVGLAQVAIVFWDLVFQNQFAPEGVPCEIGDEAMVLTAGRRGNG